MDKNQRDLAAETWVKVRPTGQSGYDIASGVTTSTVVEHRVCLRTK